MTASLQALCALSLCSLLVAQHDEVHTNRPSARVLPLPGGEDAFDFVVFGDRTGGPAEGIAVLEQAVSDTNLLDPDLVMTVGDLIQGYNRAPEWLVQMREYRRVMQKLAMPWFPVAGNHDVYYRGDDKPPEEHEKRYEIHFGPLWYAFEHEQCWFVVLYSDEADPETGERNFNKAECQRMSPEQLAWLEATLEDARDAPHVFVFLHHPRWIGGSYGDDWNRVHRVLADAGNVSAVFAGHIHRMRYDGERDGIEYFALATTGGSLSAEIPGAGYLHHFNVVTVRQDKISVATIPVGAVLDPREITGEVSEDVADLNRGLRGEEETSLELGDDGAVDQVMAVTVHNPSRRPIEVTLTPQCADRRFRFAPDHVHRRLEPDGRETLRVRVRRAAAPWDDPNFAMPSWTLSCDYLGDGVRIALPSRTMPMSASPPAFAEGDSAEVDSVLRLEGRSCLRLADARLELPDGAFTCEAWMRADALDGRRALVAKTENSEWSLFVSDGYPSFSVHLDGSYATARSGEPLLETGVWYHVAGVYDGKEVRLYVDGERVARVAAGGARTRSERPLYVGADPDRHGEPMSFFTGCIDDVRLSAGVRYVGETFSPRRPAGTDDETLLLLHMDSDRGVWTLDSSGHGRHPERVGSAHCEPRQ